MEINQVNNQVEYFTNANGARPYKVIIINNTQVNVYKSSNKDDEDYNKLVLDITPQQIFIGKSKLNKMTEFSGGHGYQFDGNTILLKVNDSICIYIEDNIMLFHTINPVVSYHSPIGNNDVSYPYAVDSANNYYLIIEDIIVKSIPQLKNYLDNDKTPYDYYYDAGLITCDKGVIPNAKPIFSNNFNIDEFYIGGKSYTMRYTPIPAKNYDRLTSYLGSHIYIRDHNNTKHQINKKQYIEIMEDFAITIGVSPMLNSLVLDKIE